jgi:hypothetical protein
VECCDHAGVTHLPYNLIFCFSERFLDSVFSLFAGVASCAVLQRSAVRRRADETPVAQSGRHTHPHRSAAQSFWQALRHNNICTARSDQDDCGTVRFDARQPKHPQCIPGTPFRRARGSAWQTNKLMQRSAQEDSSAIRFAGGRPKHPQCSPGNRNLHNAIRVPPFFSEREHGRNAVILAVQDCVAEVSVARTALLMFRSPRLRCGYFGRPAAKRTERSSRALPRAQWERGTQTALRTFWPPGLRRRCFGRPPANRAALHSSWAPLCRSLLIWRALPRAPYYSARGRRCGGRETNAAARSHSKNRTRASASGRPD